MVAYHMVGRIIYRFPIFFRNLFVFCICKYASVFWGQLHEDIRIGNNLLHVCTFIYHTRMYRLYNVQYYRDMNVNKKYELPQWR